MEELRVAAAKMTMLSPVFLPKIDHFLVTAGGNINIYLGIACTVDPALREIECIGKKYICVESYRNEEQKANPLYWQVTCEAFKTSEECE